MLYKIFLPLLCVAVLLSATPVLAVQGLDAQPALPDGKSSIELAYEVMTLVNNLRAGQGLGTLNPNSILIQNAQVQAEYMASLGTVTHYGADGSRPFQRALAAGFSVGGDLDQGGYFSENIMFGPGLTPAAVVDMWMGDELHQNTMLSVHRTDMGAGVAVVGDIYYYVLDTGLASSRPIAYTPAAGQTGPGGGWAVPVLTQTPQPDGSIVHMVREGESLWSIAAVYGLTVEQAGQLNRRNPDRFLYPGEKLLMREAVTPTPQPIGQRSRNRATRTPDAQLTAMALVVVDQSYQAPLSDAMIRLIWLSVIVAALAIGIVIVLDFRKAPK